MAIEIHLPKTVEEKLRAELGDLGAVGQEAMLVELYRQGTISHEELAQSLGLSRHETDGVLKRHNVTEDLLSSEELAEQVAGLRKLVGS